MLRRESRDRPSGGLRRGQDRRRGRAGGAFEDEIGSVEFGGAPGQERALSLLVDQDSRLVKHFGDVDAALTHRAGQRLAEHAVRPLLVASERSRGGVEGDQNAGFRVDEAKAGRQRRPLRRIGIRSRRVEHDDARPAGQRRERMNEIGHPNRLDRRVGVAPDLGVDRHEIIVAVVLDPAAGEVDESLQIGPGRRRLVEKVAQRRAQRLAVEIARADHIESGRLQRLGDEAGVVGGRGQRLIPIGLLADDERNARIGRRDFAPQRETPPRRQARRRSQKPFSIRSCPSPAQRSRFADWRDA